MIYTLTPCKSDTFPVCYNITLNPDDEILKAHFPGRTIVPGAALIQMAADAVSEHLNHAITIESLHNVKFLKPLTPENNGAELHINATLDGGKAVAVIASGDVKFATITFRFK